MQISCFPGACPPSPLRQRYECSARSGPCSSAFGGPDNPVALRSKWCVLHHRYRRSLLTDIPRCCRCARCRQEVVDYYVDSRMQSSAPSSSWFRHCSGTRLQSCRLVSLRYLIIGRMTLSRGNLPCCVHLLALPGRSSQAILECARASSTHRPLLGAFCSSYDAGSAGAAAAGLEARDRYDLGIMSISMAQRDEFEQPPGRMVLAGVSPASPG